jgi:hypothetical protein
VSGIKRTPADAAFSNVVRMHVQRCERCYRSDGRLECAHLVGRRVAVLRWDLLNAVCLCHNCHRYFTEEPKAFSDWIEQEFPGRWEVLEEKRRALVKNNKATRAEVAAHYRRELKRMEQDDCYYPESWI